MGSLVLGCEGGTVMVCVCVGGGVLLVTLLDIYTDFQGNT